MKFWKGINSKNGQYGVMDDNGFVPDSIECTEIEYKTYEEIQKNVILPKSDIIKLIEFAKLQGWV